MKCIYRVSISLILAIASSVFAVDNLSSILQATTIEDTSATLEWQTLPKAVKYQIKYDTEEMIDTKNPEPIYLTDKMTGLHTSVTGLTAGTSYYAVVDGYDATGQKIGSSYPLHFKTAKSLPPFVFTREPFAQDSRTIEMGFSRPVDIKSAQFKIIRKQNKKSVAILETALSTDDTRHVILTLRDPIQTGQLYEVRISKLIARDGAQLSPEIKIPYTIMLDETATTYDVLSGKVQKIKTQTTHPDPEKAEKLPKTGPDDVVFVLLFALFLAVVLQTRFAKSALVTLRNRW